MVTSKRLNALNVENHFQTSFSLVNIKGFTVRSRTNVLSVKRHFIQSNIWTNIYQHIQERNHIDAMNVARHSVTIPACQIINGKVAQGRRCSKTCTLRSVPFTSHLRSVIVRHGLFTLFTESKQSFLSV